MGYIGEPVEAAIVLKASGGNSPYELTLDLGGGEEFVANVLDETFFADPIDIGDRVIARWSASEIKLLDDGAGAREAQPTLAAAG